MANLRTDNLCGEGGRNAIRGSVFFIEAGDSLTVPAGSDFAYGTGDFTFEAYVWKSSFASDTRLIFSQTVSGNNYILFGITTSGQVVTILGHSNSLTSTATIALNSWNHVAVSRSSGTVKVFVNGVASSGSSITTDLNDTTRIPTIGKYTHSNQLQWQGYISNFRITKGEALYTADFTPPTSELTAGDNTVLLCCQNSDDVTQEETGKTITGFGRYADSSIELVTNPSFNNGTTGWTLSDANEGSMAVVNGSLVLTNDDSSDPPVYAWQAVTLVVGQRYVLKVHFSGGTGTPGSNLAVYLNTSSSFGSSAGGFMTADSVSANGIKTMEFTASAATTYVLVRVNANAAGTSIFSTVSIKAADYGDAPKVTPPYGVDAGNTFNGAISMNSPSWMYFPTGRTEERGRGRGVLSGGRNDHAMQFINIQSQGNSQTFGDSITGDGIEGFAVGSSTRGLFSGGYPSVGNVIEFITFTTTSNGTDFGDMTTGRRSGAGAGNETRGLFAGGLNSSGTSLNTIEFSTIASLGNSTDFGDMTQARDQLAGCSDTTRAIFAGGVEQSGSQHNIMDFVTISTAGNAQDFGDMTGVNTGSAGSSDSTRGVITVGYTAPNSMLDRIDFITIQSAGNAQDFGDLTLARYLSANMSNSIRAVIAGGASPSASNRIDFVTIKTTGNASDFGDLIGGANFVNVGTSDSHGGLS